MKFLDCVLLVLVVSTIFLDLGAAKRKKRCRKAPNPKRTVRSGCKQPYNHGETCTYRCKKNYVPVGGDAERTCRNGAWTGSHLICRLGQNCGPPPNPPCTTRQDCNSPYKHKETCNYQCEPRCTQVGGDQVLRCYDGTWTGTPLVCNENCGDPPRPAFTTVADCAAPYTHGEVCNYQCDDESTEQGGDDTQTCINGNWDGEDLVCIKNCVAPPMPDCTTVDGCVAPYTHGEVCNYQCDDESTEQGGDDTQTCINGNWDGEDLVCIKDCEAPPMPACTTIAGCVAPYTHGEVCSYLCAVGCLQLTGDNTLTCNNGEWLGVPLVCITTTPATTPYPSCPQPPDPPPFTELVGCNPAVPGPYPVGSKCIYLCLDKHYYVAGAVIVDCTYNFLFRVLVWAWRHPGPLECREGEDCDDPPEPECTTYHGCQAPFEHCDECTYQCDPPYTPQGGDAVLKCLDGNWIGEPLKCKKDCPAPPTPTGTTHTGCTPPYIHGTVCNYDCKNGYCKTGGDDSLTCNDGTWDGEQLVCEKECDPPPMPANTMISSCSAPYKEGDCCDYDCVSGYSYYSGDSSLYCIYGSWDGVPLECKKDCDPPPTPTGTTHSGCTPPYIHGTVCNYDCETGYCKTGGDDSLTCNCGTWDGEQLVCEKECDPPPMPPNTMRSSCSAPYKEGDCCDYDCVSGYSYYSGDSSLYCIYGSWDGVPLECKKDCDPPPMPTGTTHSGCTPPYEHDEVCNYDCKNGYCKTGGDDYLTCNCGDWDGEELECKKDCMAPPSATNASPSGCTPPYKHDDACDYQCDAGYMQNSGDPKLYCNDGNWDGSPLVCDPITTPAPMMIMG